VVRFVVVKDTLKPVIGLTIGGKSIHVSAAEDKGVNGESNLAKSYFMAESRQTAGQWAIGAIAAGVVGVVLVAFTRKSSNTDIEQLV